MGSVNKAIIVGRLGRDAETRHTGNGTAVTSFSVATERRFKSNNELKSQTDWHNIILWEREGLSKYLLKGKEVAVLGRLQTRSWEDKEGNKKYVTEIIAEDIQLLGGRGEKKESSEAWDGPSDDDVPF